MRKYKIKASYSTGDSHGSHDEEETLEFEWDSIDIAKKNLQRMKEHYEFYEKINDSWEVKDSIISKIKEEAKSKDWFHYDEEYKMYTSLYLLNNKEEKFLFSASLYCGYFEHLQYLEIIVDDSDLKVEF